MNDQYENENGRSVRILNNQCHSARQQWALGSDCNISNIRNYTQGEKKEIDH
jgi:hypothetical protein